MAISPGLVQAGYDGVPLAHPDGRTGIWFSESDADRILFQLEKIPTYKDTVKLQADEIGLLKGAVHSATTAVALKQEAVEQEQEYREFLQNQLAQSSSSFIEDLGIALLQAAIIGAAIGIMTR